MVIADLMRDHIKAYCIILYSEFFIRSNNISSIGLLHVSGSGRALGNDEFLKTSSTFPPSPCSIPPLLEGRYAHSSIFLPGVKLVICGGRFVNGTIIDACLSWEPGNSTWHFCHTMR